MGCKIRPPIVALLSGFLSALSAPALSQEGAQSTLNRICDLSAASALDPNRPNGIPGVASDKIDFKVAIPACESALEVDPRNPRLMFQLARALSAAKEYEKARRLYEQAASAGNALAMYTLYVFYQQGQGVSKDIGEAVRWLKQSAEGGFALSMSALGRLYYFGELVPQDYGEARRWLEKAAAAGNSVAMHALGVMYRNGSGVPADYSEARRLFEKAAEAGEADAMKNLGVMYHNGEGVPRDYAKARDWAEKAAAQGNATAMYNLGAMLENGEGGPKDRASARRWYEKAVAAGYGRANERLAFLDRALPAAAPTNAPTVTLEQERKQEEDARSQTTAKAEAERRKDADCRGDLRCWGEKHSIKAAFACRERVERLATFQFEWTDGWLEPKFSRYRWKDKDNGVVTYLGDKIKFQNGFGAWQFHIYTCDYDAALDRVLNAEAMPGRLP